MFNLADAVTVVLGIFGVVVGVALERFLTESPMVRKYERNCPNCWLRGLFFWSSLTMLISVILRFFIGATIQLHDAYVSNLGPMPRFFKDLAFLIVFGVFLVKVGLSKTSIEFTRWLMWFFGCAITWSLIAIVMRTDQDLALLWLILNLIQLGITAVCCWLLDKKPSWVPYILASLAVCYAILFGFDLEKMSKTRNLFM
jgi:hypothetical protein